MEDVLSLPLDNYDLVLDIQWLIELGNIRWNFKDLQMRFMIGNTECMLKRNKGIQYPMITISIDRLDKVLTK